MTDSQFTHHSLSSPYSFSSSQYWCSTCRRTFSELNLGSSQAQCPRCFSLSERVPSYNNRSQDIPLQRTQASSSLEEETLSYSQSPTEEEIPDNLTSQSIEITVSESSPSQSQNSSPEQAESNSNPGPSSLPGAVLYFFEHVLLSAGVPVVIIGSQYGHIMVIEVVNENAGEGAPPASQEDIEKRLESFNYMSKDMQVEESCPICQESYKEGEELVKLQCKHDYHKDCVVKWLNMHNACPMCRQAI